MKTYNILTIFPRMFESPFSLGVVSKGIESGLLQVNPVDIREYTKDKHRTTDDYQYGGGQGLVMKPEPIGECVKDVRKKNKDTRVILLDPRGRKFDQKEAERLLEYDNLTFLCGRYEGIDERVIEQHVDESLSLGDFVLSGGELAAMTVIDSVARLIPGVLGDENSPVEESHTNGLLEYPHYTRPAEYEGLGIPDVLLSGHHAEIEKWRRTKSLEITAERRPELLATAELSKQERIYAAGLAKKKASGRSIYLALLHYPMRDKCKNIVSTSITNMDLHDISRSCTTYAVKSYFVVTPLKAQQEIASRVMSHWLEGYGSTYNENRKEAFTNTRIVDSLVDAVYEIEKAEGVTPAIVATTARTDRNTVSYKEISDISEQTPILLLFGTGWGFTEDIFRISDYILDPIPGVGEFNHLSVRSAVAIILDRIHRF